MTPLPKPARRGPKARKPLRRTSRPRPVRQSASARMERKADALWRVIVKARSVFCQRECGELAVDPHHLIAKSRGNAVRWIPANGVHLCRRCHDVAQGSAVLNESLGRWVVGDEGWEALVRLSRVRDGRGAAAHVEMLKRYAGSAGIDTQEIR
jgi:hypothetical protein